MEKINVFIDTATVNRLLEITTEKLNNVPYEEDRLFLSKIQQQYVKTGIVTFFVNPSVKEEIKNTKNEQRKSQLLGLFNKFSFTQHNKTVFPTDKSTVTFPVTFVSEEEKKTWEELYKGIPHFRKDLKIFADAISNSEIDILLTTDREHLANNTFRNRLKNEELHKKIKIFTPKEFFDYLQKGKLWTQKN